jgi:hypothetical protein
MRRVPLIVSLMYDCRTLLLHINEQEAAAQPMHIYIYMRKCREFSKYREFKLMLLQLISTQAEHSYANNSLCCTACCGISDVAERS